LVAKSEDALQFNKLKAARLDFLITNLNRRRSVILELADFRTNPGQNAAFEEAIKLGVETVIQNAKGFQGYKLTRGIESTERYVLQIFWDTIEDHTVGFRQSPAFADWRAIVGPFFAVAPAMEHFELVTESA
jgi:heme-degrading monooxygenase HmoA